MMSFANEHTLTESSRAFIEIELLSVVVYARVYANRTQLSTHNIHESVMVFVCAFVN